MLERARLQVIDVIEDMIADVEAARTVPLSSSVMVSKDDFRDKLQSVKDDLSTVLDGVVGDLPEELRAARWMVRERESYIARTNEKAREVLAKARARAEDMVSESSIVAEAVEEANILVRRAEGEARLLRLETEDEIEKNLQRVESILTEVMDQIQAARDELHQARPKPPEVPI